MSRSWQCSLAAFGRTAEESEKYLANLSYPQSNTQGPSIVQNTLLVSHLCWPLLYLAKGGFGPSLSLLTLFFTSPGHILLSQIVPILFLFKFFFFLGKPLFKDIPIPTSQSPLSQASDKSTRKSKLLNISLTQVPRTPFPLTIYSEALRNKWKVICHWSSIKGDDIIVRWSGPWLLFSLWYISLASIHDGTFLRNISWLPQNRGKSLFWTRNMAKFFGVFFFDMRFLAVDIFF